jgi:hypothetical protein
VGKYSYNFFYQAFKLLLKIFQLLAIIGLKTKSKSLRVLPKNANKIPFLVLIDAKGYISLVYRYSEEIIMYL